MVYSSGMKKAASFIGHITIQVAATKQAGSGTLAKLSSSHRNGEVYTSKSITSKDIQ
jgi:hypothetical protein